MSTGLSQGSNASLAARGLTVRQSSGGGGAVAELVKADGTVVATGRGPYMDPATALANALAALAELEET